MKELRMPTPVFIPSLGMCCPRNRCGMTMTETRCEDFIIISCRCGYICREQSGEMKADWAESCRMSSRPSGGWR